MKKTLLLAFGCLTSCYSFAQNTFPANGNVGIGTSNPLSAFHLVVNSPNYGDPQYQSGIRVNDTNNSSGLLMGVAADKGVGYIQTVQPNVSWTSRNLNLQPFGGNVGVGTDQPEQRLTVKGGGIGFDWNAADKKLYSPADGVLEWMTHDWAGIHGFAVSHQGEKRVFFNTNGNSYIMSGNVGIGTTTPDTKLAVKGTVHAQEVKVDMSNWGDYVFKPSYALPSLKRVDSYIQKNHHLPEIPSATEIETNGASLGELVKLQMKKIEELTLYLIEQKKDIENLKRSNTALKKALKVIKK